MAKKLKSLVALALSCATCATALSGLAGCTKKFVSKQTEVNYATSSTPAAWNRFTYKTAEEGDVADYCESGFFRTDYVFDSAKGGRFRNDGSVNAEAIVKGAVDFQYGMATSLKDVTAEHKAKWGFTDDQVKEGGYAWEVTLREDLKWSDGEQIDASDFVYSMKELLNPKFKNYRSNSYYQGDTTIINAKKYVYQGKSGIAASSAYKEYSADLDEKLIFSVTKNYWDAVGGVGALLSKYNYTIDSFFVANGVSLDDFAKLEGKSFAEIKANAELKALWDKIYTDIFEGTANQELLFFVVVQEQPEISFDQVGFYSPSQYKIVFGFESSLSDLLKDDGSLRVWALTRFGTPPLVQEKIYESCKQAPKEGSSLWTSTYATSVETTPSYGPYKLVSFEAGKAYSYEKNDNWYAFKLPEFKNQYNINKINYEVVKETATAWDKFFAGELDSKSIDSNHKVYKDSVYAHYAPGGYSFALNLFADIEKLSANGRNNGIMAIKDFRKALSLGVSRRGLIDTFSVSNRPAFGLVDDQIYFDIENAATDEFGGVYRYSTQAKEALLRSYGFTKGADGKWSGGNVTGATLDEAYDGLTGYDLAQAKECVKRAYDELVANASRYGYNPNETIKIKYAVYQDVWPYTDMFTYVKESIEEITKGTGLEGKIELVKIASGEKTFDWFDANSVDIILTGWGGDSFNPAGMFDYVLDPETATCNYRKTDLEMVTFTAPAGDYPGAGQEYTMSLLNLVKCLSGSAEEGKYTYTFDWCITKMPQKVHLDLLAKVEEVALSYYSSVPVMSTFGASLLGLKLSYLTEDYNMFMGFGGLRYMQVNYTPEEWTTFVKETNGGNLEDAYKKTVE